MTDDEYEVEGEVEIDLSLQISETTGTLQHSTVILFLFLLFDNTIPLTSSSLF